MNTIQPRRAFGFAIGAALFLAASVSAQATIPAGAGQWTADLGGTSLTVFTFRPPGCVITGALLVFHGFSRTAEHYRDYATSLGQSLRMLVVAPLFDAAHFPDWRYEQGGIARRGEIQPPDPWTVALVPRLAAWVRNQEGRPDLPYTLIGHSAGGQFLNRVIAFGDVRPARVIIANPGTWVRPDLNTTVPFGLGGLYAGADGEIALRRYLAAPVTVLLGQEDVRSRELSVNPNAMAEGRNRLERGESVFRQAQDVARQRGWPFNWRMAVVPGVGHDARSMFASAQALEAARP